MSKLEWREPPPHVRRGNSAHAALVAELKANPGRWAMIGTWHNRQRGDYLKKHYGLKIATNQLSKGVFEIYAMWPDEAKS